MVPSNTSSSSVSQVLSLDDLDAVQTSIHMGNVLQVFTRVYAIAKLVYVVFLAYGKEVCPNVPTWSSPSSRKANTDTAYYRSMTREPAYSTGFSVQKQRSVVIRSPA